MRLSALGFCAEPVYLFRGDRLYSVERLAGAQIFTSESVVEPAQVTNYHSVLDFRTGHLTISYDLPSARIRVESVVDPVTSTFSQRVSFLNVRDSIEVRIPVIGASTKRSVSESQIAYSSRATASAADEQPGELPVLEQLHFRCRLVQGDASIGFFGEEIRVIVPHGEQDTTLEWDVSLGSEEIRSEQSFERESAAAAAWWEERWRTDIQIDGPIEDQQAIRSFLFYLYMSAPEILPPMATSGVVYKGHRFWDSEVWLLPIYALIDPERARRGTVWRLNHTQDGFVPWQAGSKGVDRTDPAFKTALHHYGWISWWLDRAVALALVSRQEAQPLQLELAAAIESRATITNGTVEFLRVESPDEGVERDNDLITNLLADRCLRLYSKRLGKRLRAGELRVELPVGPEGVPATYDNDSIRGYQQTAALLSLFPFEHSFGRELDARLFDRYKGLASQSGPAMSESVHSVIASRLGRPEEAYDLWRASWMPFVRSGSLAFSERRKRDATYFATGAAGCLQAVLYGFLGIELEANGGAAPTHSKPLAEGKRFHVTPNLPAAWRSLTFKGVWIKDGRYTIHATHEETTITKGD